MWSWLDSRFLHLVFYKTYADLRAESERTYIGFLWWIIEPVIDMMVYYVVFSLFLQRGTGSDFAPFLLIGMVTFRWFQTSVRLGGVSVIANAGLMRLVYLPKIVFPSVAILNVTVKFLPAFAILIVFLLIYGFPLTPAYAALPVLLLVELLVILALTYLIAAVVPFVPDFWVAIDTGLTMLFFLSGIFFAGSSLSGKYQFYFYLNPFAHIIENYRAILMSGVWPNWPPILWTGAGALVGIAIGSYLLARFDRLYPRSIR
ncbi:MAG: ABC transporter permease [Acidobacteria bacterium]|nr:ABC transporter permease [Acidobacteriota bacterium]